MYQKPLCREGSLFMKCVISQIRLVVILAALAAAQPLTVQAHQPQPQVEVGTLAAEHVKNMLLDINTVIATIAERGKAIINPSNKDSIHDHIKLFKQCKKSCVDNIVHPLRNAAHHHNHPAINQAVHLAQDLTNRIERVCAVLEHHKGIKDPITFGNAVKMPLKELASVASLKQFHAQLTNLYSQVAHHATDLIKLEMEQALVELEAIISDLNRQKAPGDIAMVGIIRGLLKRS